MAKSAEGLKIFVTVGAQMPFDRLVLGVDSWAASHPEHEYFAQIGPDATIPGTIPCTEFLEPPEFKQRVDWCDVLVAHAGMGSILTALQHGKPLLVMPRRGAFLETRNDHQVATAERFRAMEKVTVAMDEGELPAQLDRVRAMRAAGLISEFASPALLEAIRTFVQSS